MKKIPWLILLLLFSTTAAADDDTEAPFDFERSIRIIRLLDDRHVVYGRADEYSSSNGFNRLFEALYPYLYQIERTNSYAEPDTTNMLVEEQLRLITPNQHKTYYFGSRWLATDTKVVSISHEDYINIQDIIAGRPLPPRHPEPAKLSELIDRYSTRVQQSYLNEDVIPYREYAGWTQSAAQNNANSIVDSAVRPDAQNSLIAQSSTLPNTLPKIVADTPEPEPLTHTQKTSDAPTGVGSNNPARQEIEINNSNNNPAPVQNIANKSDSSTGLLSVAALLMMALLAGGIILLVSRVRSV